MIHAGPSPATGPRLRRLAGRLRRRIARLVADLPRRIEIWRGNPTLRATFLRRVGYPPDLRNPRSFNEKIQVRKLRDRNPLFPIFGDKVRMRTYVARVIGRAEADALCVPLLGVTARPTARWLRRFGTGIIVKANHGSGMNHLVRPGSSPNYAALVRKCHRWLGQDWSRTYWEWGYGPIPRRILVEPLLAGPDGGVPDDVKFFCFDGVARMVRVTRGRYAEERSTYLTPEWQTMPIHRSEPLMDTPPVCPVWYPEALALAERLSAGIDHLRVDFLGVPDRFWLGELTCYTSGGFLPWTPRSFDYEFGAMWTQRPHGGGR